MIKLEIHNFDMIKVIFKQQQVFIVDFIQHISKFLVLVSFLIISLQNPSNKVTAKLFYENNFELSHLANSQLWQQLSLHWFSFVARNVYVNSNSQEKYILMSHLSSCQIVLPVHIIYTKICWIECYKSEKGCFNWKSWK